MRKGSMLAGLRPRDDESETELDDEEAPESEPAPKAAKKTRSTPEETRALDARIFDAADRLGPTATLPEIADAAKVPGSSAEARRVRVAKALRRRGLLTAPAKKPSSGATAKKVQVARVSAADLRASAAITTGPAPGVRAVEALRDRLRGQLAAVEVTLAALRGES